VKKIIFILLLICSQLAFAASLPIETGAQQTKLYLPQLKGKRVAVFANHSSLVGKKHLLDVLMENHIQVVKIFAPEHGFRGEKEGSIKNGVDTKTGIPIVSLFGSKLTPSAEDLRDVDIIVFDIQDVGVRFYTYIASLQKIMEAAANNNKPLIILDRPNPNGFYVDGPVLEPAHKSFTGMQPVPIVYGMTMGEYAKMLVGQQWLHLKPASKAKELKLTIIACRHYTHKSLYVPPVKPSPNLPNLQSIYLYPSIGLLEGTRMSMGRGTTKPFQVFGHPLLHNKFTFTPTYQGRESPKYANKICHGWYIAGSQKSILKKLNHKLQLSYIINSYAAFPDKKHFFSGFSDVSGNDTLEKQIKAGLSEKKIRQSWQPKLTAFKKIRKHYLLYPDF